MEEIVNRVANSTLMVFDLEDYYQEGKRVVIDISQWLEKGFILKEKDFRENLKKHDWTQYKNCYVAINCTTDAILPAWALILVAVHVSPYTKNVISGNLQDLESAIYQEVLSKVDYSIYNQKALILKGCSKKPVPETAYITAINYLLPFAKSVSYGEACSAVPLFKRTKA